MTVTICGTFQFVASKVRLARLTAPSDVSLFVSGMVTVAAGWLLSDTPKLVLPPASLVLLLLGAETFTPAVSLSILIRLTVLVNVLL